MADYEEHEKWIHRMIIRWVMVGIFALAILTTLVMTGCPVYNVWNSGLQGKATLAHANYSREVAVAEARAKMESASLLADAEVARAKGVAAANKIIGESLKQNEEYLRYLWITDVAGSNQSKTVVYIPTEANLPILEATRHNQ